MVIPSIDLLGGRVVRLVKGRVENVKEYGRNPLKIAEEFLDAGAEIIHVVDLDAAMERGSNTRIILEMASAGVPMQVGGGIRSLDRALELIEGGVRRVILGTAAIKSPNMVEELLNMVSGDCVAVSIDYSGSRTMIRGWMESVGLPPLEVARRLEEIGVRWFIFTSVDRDGTLMGPDVSGMMLVRKTIKGKVIASGGISSIGHILDLKRIGVDGVVLGKAIYEGIIDLREAIRVVTRAAGEKDNSLS
ncbi:MAG: 1-(5-phosphoribosyl)-5-[(5-phosphoribosylamino)methylideneamino]imidazole-4-carboxamide isomerase [Candidatus Baldrarchaeia archaeon]